MSFRVLLPSKFEHGQAELERAHGEFVTAGGERISQNVVLVLAEVFDDGLLGVSERFRVDIMIPFLEHDNLAEDAKAGVHAALFREIFEFFIILLG